MNITKELLTDLYITQGKTMKEVAEILGHSTTETVSRKLKDFGIPRRKTNKRKYKLSDEEMRRLYEDEGLSIMEIAPLAGCGKSTVSRKLNKLGVDVNFRSLYTLPISKEEIKKLYVDEEKSVTEIAEIAGCTTSTISVHLEKMGIEKRPPKIEYKFDVSKEQMMEMYLSGLSSNDIGNLAGCSGSTVLNYLKEQNCDIRDAEDYTRQYEIDKTFFDQIDTQEKAYVLGLIYADGCLELGSKNMITIDLTISDSYLLKRIRNLFFPNQDRPIIYKPTTHNNGNDMSYLYISSKTLAENIQKWGVVPAKSLILERPKFDLGDLLHHFLRGYFDGDGWVSTKNRFGFVGTEDMVSWIRDILIEKGIITNEISIQYNKEKYENTVKIEPSSYESLKRFYNYIYKDAILYLERKRLKMEAMLD